jgi:hypothetical protein
MAVAIPRQGPVERYAQLRAILDKQAFLDALPGAAVLIRLDERGGDDEPAPWAFHGSGLPLPVDVPSSDEDVFMDRAPDRTMERSAFPDTNESTLTGPTFSLSIPAARGRATLHVVPAAESVTVGRDADSDVWVRERSISKRHALLVREGEAFFFVDLGSSNGLSVNGRPAQKQGRIAVASGDVVDLGDVSMLFLDAPSLWDGLPRLTDG